MDVKARFCWLADSFAQTLYELLLQLVGQVVLLPKENDTSRGDSKDDVSLLTLHVDVAGAHLCTPSRGGALQLCHLVRQECHSRCSPPGILGQ
jgi:hypothetical protein